LPAAAGGVFLCLCCGTSGGAGGTFAGDAGGCVGAFALAYVACAYVENMG